MWLIMIIFIKMLYKIMYIDMEIRFNGTLKKCKLYRREYLYQVKNNLKQQKK